MSTFAIGDIHGQYQMLRRLLDALPFGDSDTLVFVGDYVDRGPDSRVVIELLIDLQARYVERCVCLLGNHEDMLLDHVRLTPGSWDESISAIDGMEEAGDYTPGFWLTVGGAETMASYGGEIPHEHLEFIAGLPLIYEEDDFIYVHAGLNARGGTPRGQMLWGASGFWSDLDPLTGRMLKGVRRTLPKTVVVGHTVCKYPIVGADIIGIDTGAGHGGPLTAVQLPDLLFWQSWPFTNEVSCLTINGV